MTKSLEIGNCPPADKPKLITYVYGYRKLKIVYLYQILIIIGFGEAR